ncbi:MAG: hypothetical protein EG826_02105 [Deltaproteobacteria bacterium]|nr:hypothetical protein [Deltaproteobacteria bacterium]
MKKFLSVVLSLIITVCLLLQGCGLPNQPYIKKDASEAAPLEIRRLETPDYRVYSPAGMAGSMIVGGVLLGALGAGIAYGIHYFTTIQSTNPEIPDFGKMVTDKFVERSAKDIPNWPAMNVADKPVASGAPLAPKGYTVVIKIVDIRIVTDSGLGIESVIKMFDQNYNVVWEKGYFYDPNNFSRRANYEKLKADNFKLLKEEFVFAADTTVNDFITHFKNSLNTAAEKNSR